MIEISRRFALGGLFAALAAPAIIRTPGLLMPLGRDVAALMGPTLELFGEDGSRWVVPVVNGAAVLEPSRAVSILQHKVLYGGKALSLSTAWQGDTLGMMRGDTLRISGLAQV